MTFSIVIMVGRGYFLPTHVHEASNKNGFKPNRAAADADSQQLLCST